MVGVCGSGRSGAVATVSAPTQRKLDCPDEPGNDGFNCENADFRRAIIRARRTAVA
jgi:hypothetical protein